MSLRIAVQQALEHIELAQKRPTILGMMVSLDDAGKVLQAALDEDTEQILLEMLETPNPGFLLVEEKPDPAIHFCHRFRIMLECALLDNTNQCWAEAHSLIEEYETAMREWRGDEAPHISPLGKE